MNIKVLDKKKEKLRFSVSGINPSIANSFRRLMSHEVPVMAIELVEFKQNSSVLYDEVIAHRLGLVPLKTDLSSYILPSESKGPGDARAELKLTLKAQGPGTVYSGDLKSKDPKVKPVFNDIPIVKLLEGQELELEATAVLGQGKSHTKFSPGLVFYRQDAKVKVTSSKTFDKSKFPAKVVKGGKVDPALVEKHELFDAVAGVDDSVKVEFDPTSYVFTIESWGQLDPKEIVETSTEMLTKQLKELTALLKSV